MRLQLLQLLVQVQLVKSFIIIASQHIVGSMMCWKAMITCLGGIINASEISVGTREKRFNSV